MKNSKNQTAPRRGMMAKIFMAMLAMSAMSSNEKGTVDVNPSGGMWGYSNGKFYTRKHSKKSYAQQNRDARKRRNILSRSKH